MAANPDSTSAHIVALDTSHPSSPMVKGNISSFQQVSPSHLVECCQTQNLEVFRWCQTSGISSNLTAASRGKSEVSSSPPHPLLLFLPPPPTTHRHCHRLCCGDTITPASRKMGVDSESGRIALALGWISRQSSTTTSMVVALYCTPHTNTNNNSRKKDAK